MVWWTWQKMSERFCWYPWLEEIVKVNISSRRTVYVQKIWYSGNLKIFILSYCVASHQLAGIKYLCIALVRYLVRQCMDSVGILYSGVCWCLMDQRMYAPLGAADCGGTSVGGWWSVDVVAWFIVKGHRRETMFSFWSRGEGIKQNKKSCAPLSEIENIGHWLWGTMVRKNIVLKWRASTDPENNHFGY